MKALRDINNPDTRWEAAVERYPTLLECEPADFDQRLPFIRHGGSYWCPYCFTPYATTQEAGACCVLLFPLAPDQVAARAALAPKEDDEDALAAGPTVRTMPACSPVDRLHDKLARLLLQAPPPGMATTTAAHTYGVDRGDGPLTFALDALESAHLVTWADGGKVVMLRTRSGATYAVNMVDAQELLRRFVARGTWPG